MSTTNAHTHNIDRQGSERQNYGAYFQDGLLDIFIGLGFVVAGALMFADLGALMGIFPASLLPLWGPARKKTLERMQMMAGGIPVAFLARTRAVILGAMVALMGSFALGLFAFMAFDKIPPSYFEWLRQYHALVLGAIIALVFVVCGFVLSLRRLHLYAVLTLAFFAAGHFTAIAMPFYLLALGGVITLVGIVMLVRFLGEYPAA